MAEQLTLDHHARSSDPETSHAAARSASFGVTVKRDVLAALAAAGADGLTRDELARILVEHDMRSVGHRATDLVNDDGYAMTLLDGEGEPVTRPTRSGSPAGVLVVTEQGAAVAPEWLSAAPSVLLGSADAALNHAMDRLELECLDPNCGKRFTTPRARLAHARVVHGFNTIGSASGG